MSIDSAVSELRTALYRYNLDKHYAIVPARSFETRAEYVALQMTRDGGVQDIFHVYSPQRVAIHLYESWDDESILFNCPWNKRIVLARSTLRQHGYTIANKQFKHITDEEILRAQQVFDAEPKKSI